MPSSSPRLPKTPLFVVRSSAIDGKGVFASADINASGWIAEYTGARRTEAEFLAAKAKRRGHTMWFEAFTPGKETVFIDGTRENNGTAYINHSCAPNMQAVTINKRVFFQALRDIPEGEELTFDYGLTGVTAEMISAGQFLCRCGSKRCSGWLNARLPIPGSRPKTRRSTRKTG